MSDANLGARRLVGAAVAVAALVGLGYYLVSGPAEPVDEAAEARADGAPRRGRGGGGGGGGLAPSDDDERAGRTARGGGGARSGRRARLRTLSQDGGVARRRTPAPNAADPGHPERGIAAARPLNEYPRAELRELQPRLQLTRLRVLHGLLEDQATEIGLRLQDAEQDGNTELATNLRRRLARLEAQRPELEERIGALREQGVGDEPAQETGDEPVVAPEVSEPEAD